MHFAIVQHSGCFVSPLFHPENREYLCPLMRVLHQGVWWTPRGDVVQDVSFNVHEIGPCFPTTQPDQEDARLQTNSTYSAISCLLSVKP